MIETGEQETGEEEKKETKTLLKMNRTRSDKIICKDNRGRSPIFNACEKNNLSALQLLVEAGVDPDEEDREGWRPIQVAMTNQTGAKDRMRRWRNKETEECVFHLLRSSRDVRRKTQIVRENREDGWVTISQGGIEMYMTSNMNRDEIIDCFLIHKVCLGPKFK